MLNNGYSLLELVVVIGILTSAVVIITGIMVNVGNAWKKIANIQSVQDNIRFSLELMTKEMRVGQTFDTALVCGVTADTEIKFTTFNDISGLNESRRYYLNGTTLMRDTTGTPACGDDQPFTATDVAIDLLRFRLRNGAPGPTDGQPHVVINLTVRSNTNDSKLILRSSMNLQTTVTQRRRDF